MRVYAAAIYTNNLAQHGNTFRSLNDVEQATVVGIPHVLDSYHYINRQRYVDSIRRDGVKVFLDSGAFSAFSKGAVIDLPRYCDYINRNSDIFEVVSVLDGIGDPELTWKNQQAMHAAGVNALPCFHFGEPLEYLDHYVENYEYITLGGMVPISSPQLFKWLDRIWGDHLTNSDGTPKIKVHGFGLTAIPLMERYPWYSVDSSSWVQVSSNGSIMLPNRKTVGVSNNSPSRKTKGQHITTVSEAERDTITAFITSMGYDVGLLSTSYKHRWCFNIEMFNSMNTQYNGLRKTFINKTQELF